MEIFLTSGRTFLIAFETKGERDAVYNKLLAMNLPNRVDYESEVTGRLLKMSITDKWSKGMISNYEYLIHLNTMAGRTFNDLTQYPIMPHILADYASEELDLTNPSSFRDLSKPMGALDDKRFERFEEKYAALEEMSEVPYFYGSHYSNLGTVLHYLVRLEPFSTGFIEFQGGRFDLPDRSFHSIEQTWRLSSKQSSSDVKELIPEFFTLSNFLCNENRYDLGVKQNGEEVNHVILPPWAKGDPRRFMDKCREALECKYVSEHLHEWIDLIFGYKQSGSSAYAARNLFHPLTYEGAVDIDSITDEVLLRATIAQISSYGQTPTQLFRKPHPTRTWKAVRWTVSGNVHQLKAVLVEQVGHSLHSVRIVGDMVQVLQKNRVAVGIDKYVTWGHWDKSIRLILLESGKVLGIHEMTHEEDIRVAAVVRRNKYLLTGGSSSLLKVWHLERDTVSKFHIQLRHALPGHRGKITDLRVSELWNMIVTCGEDHTVILWDLIRLRVTKALPPFPSPVICVAIDEIAGHVLTVDALDIQVEFGCNIQLFTINGECISKNRCAERIISAQFTHCELGVGERYLMAGTHGGNILVLSVPSLEVVHVLKIHKAAVTGIEVAPDDSYMYSVDVAGYFYKWVPPSKRNTVAERLLPRSQ